MLISNWEIDMEAIIMDFTTILQIKLALSLMLLLAVYFTCTTFEKVNELFKNSTINKTRTHVILPSRK